MSIKFSEKRGNLFFDCGSLLCQREDLLQKHTKQRGVHTTGILNPKTVTSGFLQLSGFPFPKVTAAAVPKDLCQFLQMCVFDFMGCGILWLEQAAKQEVHAAQYFLGRLCLSDDPDVRDPSDGIRWMKAAAKNGNDYAAYALGKEYLSGKHVVKNLDVAAEYLHQAAEMQNPWAQYLLGKLYLAGEGMGQDADIAYQWFQAAATQDHTYAQFFVERMEQQEQDISPSLLLSATRLLHHMGNIFRDNAPQDSTTGVPRIDRKRLRELTALKIALGHRPDDHEEEQNMGGMTLGGW